jgi:hypothetical protein
MGRKPPLSLPTSFAAIAVTSTHVARESASDRTPGSIEENCLSTEQEDVEGLASSVGDLPVYGFDQAPVIVQMYLPLPSLKVSPCHCLCSNVFLPRPRGTLDGWGVFNLSVRKEVVRVFPLFRCWT